MGISTLPKSNTHEVPTVIEQSNEISIVIKKCWSPKKMITTNCFHMKISSNEFPKVISSKSGVQIWYTGGLFCASTYTAAIMPCTKGRVWLTELVIKSDRRTDSSVFHHNHLNVKVTVNFLKFALPWICDEYFIKVLPRQNSEFSTIHTIHHLT